ncbi:MAG: hypothetical protein K9L30_00475 [Desulfobacterales bacterium]|nr:hypothetical protein [Desulfobacterales bacterium]
MPEKPDIRFVLPDRKQPVDASSNLWNKPLPMDRKAAPEATDSPVTYGDYFTFARNFIEANHFKTLINAVSFISGKQVTIPDISKIRIILAKHGAFYHPAKIEISLSDFAVELVLNTAISRAGKDCIEREFSVLKRLTQKYHFDFLPQVFDEIIFPEIPDSRLYAFMGEWFNGFSEFHLSIDPSDGKQKIIVWDADRGDFYLPSEKEIDVYTQTAKIMTSCYDVTSFEQIFPWHHAAGDFILKYDTDRIFLRLITIRQYAPMFHIDDQDLSTLPDAAMLFLLNLSIRTRLDRLDGIGDMAWADNVAVKGTVKGFLSALFQKSIPDFTSLSFEETFKTYLEKITRDDLDNFFRMLIDSYHPDAPEIPLIMSNIDNHINTLYTELKDVI